MKLRNVLLAATILALPVAVKAQPISGLYIGGGAGYNYVTNTKVKDLSYANPSTGTNIYTSVPNQNLIGHGGWVGLGSVGWGFGNGLRAELEGNYRGSHETLSKNTYVYGGGTLQTYGFMVNALYDINVGLPVVPYVGVGVGYGFTQLNNFRVYTPGNTYSAQFKNTNDGSVAVQGILGVAYNIAAVPGLALTAEARYYNTLQQLRYSSSTTAHPINTTLSNIGNVSGLIGVRYAFNAAPPPPPPAPVPAPVAAPSRSYLVFFDWDKYDLTARAKQIIAEAAANSTKVQYTRIEVNGNTDTTGSAEYNQRLSVRRAEAVAAELAKDGVPRAAMDIKGFGFTRLLVPTGPGVREPQNRRVEIIYH
jgi:outer membrane protein OmpA-like peptidoglycan-associated protein